MRATQLIFFEGIPQSGKSTLSQFVALTLQRAGMPSTWYHNEVRACPVQTRIPGKGKAFVDAVLALWQAFVEQTQASGEVVVLDGYVYNILHRLADYEENVLYIEPCFEQLAQIISPLSPIVIHLYPDDAGAAMRKAFDKTGEDWAQAMTQWAEGSFVSQQRDVHGSAAVGAYFAYCRDLASEIFAETKFDTLSVGTSAEDWDAYREQILAFLSLSAQDEPHIPPDQLARFAGTYHEVNESPPTVEFTIVVEAGNLYAINFRYPKSRLIPWEPNVFFVETLGYQMTFAQDADGRIIELTTGGKEPNAGIGNFTLLGKTYRKQA